MRFILTLIFLSSFFVFGQNKISSSQAQQDFKQMYDLVKEVHYNPFLHTDSLVIEQEFKNCIDELKLTDSLSVEHFALVAMEFLAAINDAHTSINLTSKPLVPGLKKHSFWGIPVQFTEKEKIHVASGEDAGKILKSINGFSVTKLYQETMRCYGGNQSFKREIAQGVFFPIYLHLANIHAPFDVEFADNSTTRIDTGITIYELLQSSGFSKDAYTFEVLNDSIGYLAYNKCENAKRFKTFLSETFEVIKVREIDYLIIDIRENTGGNSALNDMLLNYLTQNPYRQSSGRYWKVSPTFKKLIVQKRYTKLWGKSFTKQYVLAEDYSILKEDEYGLVTPKKERFSFSGKSVLLTGPRTFSSANFLADAVATYNIMPILGLPTGENTNDFGEQVTIPLNQTKLELQVSLAYDIGADGNANRVEPVIPNQVVKEDILNQALFFFSKNSVK